MDGAKMKTSGFLMQALSTLIIANLVFVNGFIYAWPSYTFEVFKSNATVLEAPMTSGQLSLLGSLTNIGALIITPFTGFAIDKFGRKYSAMLFGLPHIIAWAIISVTKSIYLVLFSVSLTGFGAAGQAVTFIYISEISHDSVRGGFTSSVVSVFFAGLLFSHVLGGNLSYHNVIYVHLTISIMYIVLLSLLKESPVHLMKCGKERETAKAIAFYHRIKMDSNEMENTITKIKLQLDPRIDEILKAEIDGQSSSAAEILGRHTVCIERKDSPWQFLRRSESSMRALFTVLIVMSLTILMGSIAIMVYAEPLLKEAIPTMNPNTSSILLAAVYLIASLVCACTLDKFGRKSLMIITTSISGVFTILLGSQLNFHFAPHWFSAFVIYGYSFVYNLGASIVPFVLTAEVFLPEVRCLCNSICMACTWIMNFVTLVAFNPLVDSIGLGPTFYCFSVVCFITAYYSYFFLPETKGLSSDAIQVLFMKKRIRSISND